MAQKDDTGTDVRLGKDVLKHLPIVGLKTCINLSPVLSDFPSELFYYSGNSNFINGPVGLTKQHCTCVWGLMPLAVKTRDVFYGHVIGSQMEILSQGVGIGDGLYVDHAVAWDPPPHHEGEDYRCIVLKLGGTTNEAGFYGQMRKKLYETYPVFNQFGYKQPEAHVTVAYVYDKRDDGKDSSFYTQCAADILVKKLNEALCGTNVPVAEMFVDDNGFQYYGTVAANK